MKQNLYLHFFAILVIGLNSHAFAQQISEDANRYYQRGLAAMEMAKSPMDYESAIKEFQQAVRLAPQWADVYYKIGTDQEKLEKYDDAIISLKYYLKIAPNETNAIEVKNLIYKLEYKRDLLGEKDVKEAALLSGFSKTDYGGFNFNCPSGITFIKTTDGLKANITHYYTKEYDQIVPVFFDGLNLKFKFSTYRCPRAYELKQFPCEEIISVDGKVIATSPLTIKIKLDRKVTYSSLEEKFDGEWIFNK